MRLQKYMADCGVASRRESERIIEAGRVRVNGNIVREMGYKVQEGDIVEVQGKRIQPIAQHSYYLYYKPLGEISTAKDPEGRRTVIDRFAPLGKRLFPVGRLDYDTQGLLLITDDGAFMQMLTHPSREIEKTYVALVRGLPSEETLKKLREGVVLDGGKKTAPAKVRCRVVAEDRAEVTLILHEGRNRQVRRMMNAVNHDVLRLSRTGFASLTMKGLSPGKYRELTAAEVEKLKNMQNTAKREDNRR